MSIGDKIKKGILYVLLILLGAACLFPFLLMIVNATRSGVEITRSFTLIPTISRRTGKSYSVTLTCSKVCGTAYW